MAVPAAAATLLQLKNGTFTFHSAASELVTVPQVCIEQSELLRDLVESSGDAAEVALPIIPDALHLWVRRTLLANTPEGPCFRSAKRGRQEGDDSEEHETVATRQEGASRTQQRQPSKEQAGMISSSAHASSSMGVEDTCALLMVRLRRLSNRAHTKSLRARVYAHSLQTVLMSLPASGAVAWCCCASAKR